MSRTFADDEIPQVRLRAENGTTSVVHIIKEALPCG
jgi:hypothetical protein